MSIADNESEKLYPTEYWENYPTVKKTFEADSDDLQEAYLRGRTMKPTEVEIQAVVQYLKDSAGSFGLKEWNESRLRVMAKGVLRAAWKAVSEEPEGCAPVPRPAARRWNVRRDAERRAKDPGDGLDAA